MTGGAGGKTETGGAAHPVGRGASLTIPPNVPDAEHLTSSPERVRRTRTSVPLTPVDLPLDRITGFPYAVYAPSHAVDVTWTAVYIPLTAVDLPENAVDVT